MGIKNDLQKKRKYSMKEKNSLKNPTFIENTLGKLLIFFLLEIKILLFVSTEVSQYLFKTNVYNRDLRTKSSSEFVF